MQTRDSSADNTKTNQQTAILDALTLLIEPGAVTEIRIPHAVRAGTVSGYYDDLQALATVTAKWSGRAPGVYIMPNPVRPELLARAANRVRERAEQTTSDSDIARRRWVFVDFDAVRPAGISSSDAEHEAALERAAAAAVWLLKLGIPPASLLVADSGNGGHVLIRVDLANDAASTELVKRCLAAVDLQFSDALVHVDQSVFNSGRIWKLYGTLAAKGDSTDERPHRLARILSDGDGSGHMAPCPTALLQRLAALAPQPEPAPAQSRTRVQFTAQSRLDVSAWLAEHNIEVAFTGAWPGGEKWVLAGCPWNPGHTNRSAYVVQFPSGAIAAGCKHDHCQGLGWRELRALFEPGVGAGAGAVRGLGDHEILQPDRDLLNPFQLQTVPGHDLLNPRLVCMDQVSPEAVAWLWEPYIPRGKVTLIEGDPGLGKSWLTAALGSAVSVGHGLPGMADGEPKTVLILTAEDGLGDTLRPRLDAMSADVSRLYAVEGPAVLDSDGLQTLEAFITEVRPVLVILDPLVAYMGGQIDLHRANETRQLMAALAGLAARHRCAIVGVRHLAKGSAGRAIYRGLGSIDLTAACRSVLLVGADPEDEAKRAIVQIKNNLAPFGGAMGYRIDADGFSWTGESDLTATRMLGPLEDDGERSAMDEAEAFLRQVLADGPLPAEDVKAQAAALDIAVKSTLKRARSRLGIQSVPVRCPGQRGVESWVWALPEGTPGGLGDHAQDRFEAERGLGDHDLAVGSRDLLNRHDTGARQRGLLPARAIAPMRGTRTPALPCICGASDWTAPLGLARPWICRQCGEGAPVGMAAADDGGGGA